MNKKYFKSNMSILDKIKNIIILLTLAFMALVFGTIGGNILSDSKLNIIKNIDAELLKVPLNQSFPLIDTIYNSGKIDTSFIGDFKRLIGSVFDFDLNDPMTLINSQSPMFYNYYLNSYTQKDTAQNNEKIEPEPSPAPTSVPHPKATAVPEASSSLEYREDASSISTEEGNEERDYSKENVISDGKIVIQNETKFKIDINKLIREPLVFRFDRKGPKVLIYHTHTSESYVEGRFSDGRYGVVRVGEELARNLRKKTGFEVIHNATINDYDFNSSYTNASNTVSKILKGNPSVRMVFDVHRDGVKNERLRVYKKINGKNAAQIMFVVGTNATGLNHPGWRENLKLALKLQEKLNSICPGLAKPIYISKNRYNQQVKPGALIVEIGGDGNSTAESMESTKYLSEAIKRVCDENK